MIISTRPPETSWGMLPGPALWPWKKPGLFKRLNYVPRGPVWHGGSEAEVLEALAKYVRQHLPGTVLTIEPDDTEMPVVHGWQESSNTILIPCGQLTQAQWDELKAFADGAQVSNASVQSPARLVPKIWTYTVESVTNIVSMIPVQTSLTCSLRFDWNGGLSTKMIVVEGVTIDYSNWNGNAYLVDLDIMNSSLFNLPSTRFIP